MAYDSLALQQDERFAMPWNETDRAKYAVIRERYASDLSDEEFALVQPLLPVRKSCGRKPTDPRAILDALFYLIRAGCPWRYLPKDFPPFTTVQNRFYAWRDSGLWEQIVSVLVMAIREAEGRDAALSSSLTASRSKPRNPAARAAMTPARRSRAASATSRSIPLVCRSSAR